MHLPASANKAPPERTDFPRPGENVTAGDKRGNLASPQAMTEGVHPTSPPQRNWKKDVKKC